MKSYDDRNGTTNARDQKQKHTILHTFYLSYFPRERIAYPQGLYFFVAHYHDLLEGETQSKERVTIGDTAQGTFFNNVHLC